MENQVNGKLRVKSSTNYVIEVNDEGETIEFDLADIGLQAKFIECFDKVETLTQEFAPKEKECIEKILKEREGMTEEEQVLYTETEKEYIALQQQYYKDCRDSVDIFIGKGGCDKIFGTSNYPTMFFDLFEQLEPHFKKMGLSNKKMQEKLYQKYIGKKGKKTIK